MQDEDPLHHFNTLGLPTTATWEEVKRSYRHLIRRWHPDRAASDGVSHSIAEERSKEITLAYKALSNYHRAHGTLPRPAPATVEKPDPAAASAPARTPESTQNRPQPSTASGPSTGNNTPRLYVSLAVVAAVVLVLVLALPSEPDAVTVSPATTAGGPPPAEPTPAEKQADNDISQSGEIRIGSTLGDVYAIQGVPTVTSGQTWHYGQSRIHFKNGRVVNWEEHPDNPLRIAASGTHAEHMALTFGIGSSRADVLRLQGPPLRDSGSVWEYGASRVYFRGDMVIKWQESPLNPLRVNR